MSWVWVSGRSSEIKDLIIRDLDPPPSAMEGDVGPVIAALTHAGRRSSVAQGQVSCLKRIARSMTQGQITCLKRMQWKFRVPDPMMLPHMPSCAVA